MTKKDSKNREKLGSQRTYNKRKLKNPKDFYKEKTKNGDMLIVRADNGQIISYKKYDKKTYEADILYFKQKNTFKKTSEHKSYGKKVNWLGTKRSQIFYTYDYNTFKVSGVSKERENKEYTKYNFVVDGFVKYKGKWVDVHASSKRHSLSYSKESARVEAESDFYHLCGKILYGQEYYEKT